MKSRHSRKMSKFDLQQSDRFRHLKILLDRFFSNRKILLGLLCLLGFLLYFGPSWFFKRRGDSGDEHFFRLNEHLDNFYSIDVQNFDTFISRPSSTQSERSFVPFVGNGYFGLSLMEIYSPVRLRNGRTINLLSGLEPLVKIAPKFSYSFKSEAIILEIRKGSATKIIAYNLGGENVIVSSTVYCHRNRPTLLVQEITVRNPTMSSLTIAFERSTPSTSKFKVVKNEQKLTVRSAKLEVSDAKFAFMGVGQHEIPTEIIVKPQSTDTQKILTVITVSDNVGASQADSLEKEIERDIPKFYADASKDEAHLYTEHMSTWNTLWLHGFTISHSKAPDVINGNLINATIYYLLSNTPSPLHDHGVNASTLQTKRKLLYASDGCFNFHNTLMYPSKLWSHLTTVEDMLDVVYKWKLTLNKRGCSSLVNAGADGLTQAILLSLGGLKYTNHHLEFDIEPKDLHRNYYFRGIIYDESSTVNIWVEVGSNNKPVLYVSVNSTRRDQRKFYACDAGCLDAPAELSNDKTLFPVKLTDPLTPILYVTNDQKHIEELKHTIHVKEVAEAPAHEHHVIAMHKHGHRLGGLPTLFWVALIFLLITFHLFLFKLIYNEYCRDEKPNYPPVNRMRYAV